MMTKPKTLFDALVVAMVFTSGRLMQAKSFTNAVVLFTILVVIVVVGIPAVPDVNLDTSAAP
jgi:hypothetical protein